MAGIGLVLFGVSGPGRPSGSSSRSPNVTAVEPEVAELVPASGAADEGRVAPATGPAPGASRLQRITGRVLSPEGEPLADVRIVAGEARPAQQWTWSGTSTEIEGVVRALESRAEGLDGLPQTRSAADGTFALDLEGVAFERGPLLAVRAEGWLGQDRLVEVNAATADLGALELRPGRILRGQLLDASGRPLSGARIQRRGHDTLDARRSLAWEGALLATCDVQGRFTLTGAGHEELELVGAGALRRRLLLRELARALESGPLELERDAPITGRVVGAAPGAELQITSWLQEEGEIRVSCASDGSFAIEGLAAGLTLDLQALQRRPSGAWGYAASARGVATGTHGLELVVPAACTFRARLVDARSGAPLEQARLGLLEGWVLESEREVERASRGDGVHELSAVLGWTRSLTLFATDPAHQARAFGEVPYRPGEVVDLGTLALDPVAPVRVRVLAAADDAPIPGAEVAALEQRWTDEYCGNALMRSDWSAGEEVHPGWSGTTDARGEVQAALGSRVRHDVTVRHRDFLPQVQPVAPAGEAPLELVFRLVRGASIEWTCLDAVTRVPLGEQTMEAERRADDGTWERWERWSTDREGRVSAAGLPAGAWRFRLAEQAWVELPLAEGEHAVRVLEVVPPATARLHGRITDHGQPVASARVELLWGLETTTDRSGRYVFEGLDVRNRTLKVTHPEHGPLLSLEARIEGLETRLDLELALRTLAGRVLDAEGQPLADAEVAFGHVSATGAFLRSDVVRSAADGGFAHGPVAESVHTHVEARAEGWRPARLELPAGEARGLELRLLPAATLTLVLEHAEHALVVFGEARAEWQGGGELPPGEWIQRGVALPGEAGSSRFRFAHLAPGPWRIAYGSFLDDEERVASTVVLAAGENAPLVLGL